MEQERKESILLIGFMGCGKTTVSACLHQKLAREEVDTDQKIVEKMGMRIPDIFENYGEAHFRKLETELLEELKEKDALIISCGGGMAMREENVTHMKELGKVVLLTARPDTILSRVKDGTERPLLQGNMNEAFIEQLLDKRREKYEAAADMVVATDGKSVEDICEEIITKMQFE